MEREHPVRLDAQRECYSDGELLGRSEQAAPAGGPECPPFLLFLNMFKIMLDRR
jgi:hypothetical protein